MGSESTPGGITRIRCPHCSGPVFFILSGGPNHLGCTGCGRSFNLDVVHDGRKWTVRRLRKATGTVEERA